MANREPSSITANGGESSSSSKSNESTEQKLGPEVHSHSKMEPRAERESIAGSSESESEEERQSRTQLTAAKTVPKVRIYGTHFWIGKMMGVFLDRA